MAKNKSETVVVMLKILGASLSVYPADGKSDETEELVRQIKPVFQRCLYLKQSMRAVDISPANCSVRG